MTPSHSMKPIRAAPGIASPAAETGLTNESLYGVWATHCVVNYVDGDHSIPDRLMQRPIFVGRSFSRVDVREISLQLGISEEAAERSLGKDMYNGAAADCIRLVPELRYCIACLRFGYHSILFQHPAIGQCPIHSERLRSTCPACGGAIIPTLKSAMNHPFECPICLHSFSNAVRGAHDGEHAHWADQLLGSRRAVLGRSDDVRIYRAKTDIGPVGGEISSAMSRQFQRACVWAAPGDVQWTRFRELERHFRSAEGDISLETQSLNLKRTTERILIWLRRNCLPHENCVIRMAYRLGSRPDGLRLDAHASVVGTALFKLLVNYRLVREMIEISNWEASDIRGYGLLDKFPAPLRYGPSTPDLPILDCELLQLEMLAAFAKLLVREKSRSPLVTVNWLDFPLPIEFIPSLRTSEIQGTVSCRIRTRAAETLVLRLLQRRWNDEHCLDPQRAGGSAVDARSSVWWEGLDIEGHSFQAFRPWNQSLTGALPPPGEGSLPKPESVTAGWVAMEVQRMWEALSSRDWTATSTSGRVF